jgi:hypothetical protein
MFVVLQHDTSSPDTPSAARLVHWDFLIEQPGQERLPTWRLTANPLTSRAPIPAERLSDHRRAYLEYEGAIPGGRGTVCRLDRGSAILEHLEGDELRATVRGAALAGHIEITRDASGQLLFRRA